MGEGLYMLIVAQRRIEGAKSCIKAAVHSEKGTRLSVEDLCPSYIVSAIIGFFRVTINHPIRPSFGLGQ